LRKIALVLALLLAVPLFAAGTFTVTNINDSGPGSLRQAVLDANASGGNATIEFAIGSGPQRIALLSRLPILQPNITVDGRTQPGYAGKPLIELDGGLKGANTWGFFGTDMKIYALVIHSMYEEGVVLSGTQTSVIQGCYIGTNADGTLARPNKRRAISVSAINAIIGGPNPGEGNVLVGTRSSVGEPAPITLFMGGHGSIVGNRFGMNAAGTQALGGGNWHINVRNLRTVVVENNDIATNASGMILPGASNVTIRGNRIGDVAGNPRGRYGLEIRAGIDLLIEDNRISNTGAAISLQRQNIGERSRRVVITRNEITGNGFGIDLSRGNNFEADGPNSNDATDADDGNNGLLNYPVLERVASVDGTTLVEGVLRSKPNVTYTIELFTNAACNASGFGEGAQFFESFDVTTGPDGLATFSQSYATGLDAGSVMAATTTTADEGTSEFSQCAAVEGAGVFSIAGPANVAEAGGSGTYTVTRNGGAFGEATVSYAAVSGSAMAGQDFTPSSGTLTFPDGDTSGTIVVPIVNDTLYEGPQNFTVTLSNATGGSIGSPASAGTVIADDEAQPQLSAGNAAIDEGDSGLTPMSFPLTLSPASEEPVVVHYHTSDVTAEAGEDYVAVDETVTFASGETTKSVQVDVIGDLLYEGHDIFHLFASIDGQPGAMAAATIRNDEEVPIVSVADTSVREADGSVTVTLTASSTSPVTGLIRLIPGSGTAVAGRDFSASSVFVEFHKEESKTVNLTVFGDDELEGDETFSVRVVRHWGNFEVGDEEAVVTIEDDDIRVDPRRLQVPAGQTRSVSIDLGGPAGSDVVFTVASDSVDVTVPAVVTLPAGNSSITFDVAAHAPGRNATVLVTLPSAFGGGTAAVQVTTYIEAELRFSPPRLDLGIRQTATVSASLFPAQSEPVTVSLLATEEVSTPERIVIPPGGEASFEITGVSPGVFVVTATLPNLYRREKFAVTGQVRAGIAPAVTDVAPGWGSTAGGTFVHLTGRDFTANCWPFFGGIPARFAIVRDQQSISATAPPHGTGGVDVEVRCTGGSASLTRAFIYVALDDPLPQIADVEPLAGAPGDVVTLTGIRFRVDATVRVADVPARILDASPESYTIVLPDIAPGEAGVSIYLGDVLASTTGPILTILPATPPVITGVVPDAAGAELALAGTRFREGFGFAVGGQRATILSLVPSRVVLRLPAELRGGAHRVDVVDTAGAVVSMGPVVTVTEQRLRVLSVAPSCANVDGGAQVTIAGTGFDAGAVVTFDGLPATDVEVVDAATITVRVPANAAGSATVEVRNLDARSSTLTESFRYASSFDPDGCENRMRSVRR